MVFAPFLGLVERERANGAPTAKRIAPRLTRVGRSCASLSVKKKFASCFDKKLLVIVGERAVSVVVGLYESGRIGIVLFAVNDFFHFTLLVVGCGG